MGVPSTIGGRHKAISNYRRRWINFNTRSIIHKIRYIFSSIIVPPLRLFIVIDVVHPHSYKGFSSIKGIEKREDWRGE